MKIKIGGKDFELKASLSPSVDLIEFSLVQGKTVIVKERQLSLNDFNETSPDMTLNDLYVSLVEILENQASQVMIDT